MNLEEMRTRYKNMIQMYKEKIESCEKELEELNGRIEWSLGDLINDVLHQTPENKAVKINNLNNPEVSFKIDEVYYLCQDDLMLFSKWLNIQRKKGLL